MWVFLLMVFPHLIQYQILLSNLFTRCLCLISWPYLWYMSNTVVNPIHRVSLSHNLTLLCNQNVFGQLTAPIQECKSRKLNINCCRKRYENILWMFSFFQLTKNFLKSDKISNSNNSNGIKNCCGRVIIVVDSKLECCWFKTLYIQENFYYYNNICPFWFGMLWILIQLSFSHNIQPIGTAIKRNESQIFLFRVICCPT